MQATPCARMGLIVMLLTLSKGVFSGTSYGHEGHHELNSRVMTPEQSERIQRLNTKPIASEPFGTRLVLQRDSVGNRTPAPEIAKFFQAFEESVKLRWDRNYLYVESSGMPEHPMMTGIVAWQQQVPLPQDYSGTNAWRIPLNPKPAANPISAKTSFFRGAIALAVNGVPIFNPIKNDGRTDTLLAGELDQWGGHCGRADDYHYHIAPMHLQEIVGKENPIAFALDGYPIYGYQDSENATPKLDRFNGYRSADGEYRYQATRRYPYINGGFYGEVNERGGQVDPQPKAEPIRPAMRPLRGAKITGFKRHDPRSYSVLYQVSGEDRQVNYRIADDRSVSFEYVSPSGTKRETYRPRPGGGRAEGDRRPGEQGPDRRPRRGPPPNRGN